LSVLIYLVKVILVGHGGGPDPDHDPDDHWAHMCHGPGHIGLSNLGLEDPVASSGSQSFDLHVHLAKYQHGCLPGRVGLVP
jgi:hypothetical protein